MDFDFVSVPDRRGMDALAVDAICRGGDGSFAPMAPGDGFSVIPMWVADMNFATCPAVTRHISDRLAHPLFGYFMPSDAYYDAIIAWQRDRNGVNGLTREAIGYENGVLGCVASAVQAFSSPGDGVLVHSPTYIGFTHTLDNNGRSPVLSPLKRDENGVWRMDYGDMDRRLKENRIHLAIFCSPHNPCGRVWEEWEIRRAMEVYRDNDCIVISDEIWSDILLDGHRHIPTQSVSEDARNRTVAVYAPSKTFNLAGLIGSYHVIRSPYLRDRLRRQSECCHYNSMNVLSMHALIGAYSPEGRKWTDELCAVISKNIDYACAFMAENFPGVDFARPEGTYMVFLHCEDWCRTHGLSLRDLLRKGWEVGVGWQSGEPFHDPWGIRINFALPFSLVTEAMARLKKHVFTDV